MRNLLKNILPLVLIIGAALFIRIVMPYNQIFTNVGIKFSGNDAYYHMRIVDNLVANFPHMTFYDPYFILPNGTYLTGQHLFDWLLASLIWLIGLGHPTAHLVDVVGVYFPAVVGALIVIPVYFLGKILFNKWVGWISAGLMAILAGEFLGRSIIGSTDHHVTEVLFSTVAMLFVVMAIKAASKKRVVLFSVIAGICLGIYLLTWTGGLLFVIILSAYFGLQNVIDHINHKRKLNIIGSIAFPIALVMNYSVNLPKIVLWVMIIASLLPLVMFGLSWAMRKINIWVYPIIMVVVAVTMPFIPSVLNGFKVFLASGASIATTSELKPIFFPNGSFSLSAFWSNFTTGIVLIPLSLFILIKGYIKKFDKAMLLLIVWTLIMLVLTIIQRRYAYYLAVNIAVVIGYFCSYFYEWVMNKKKPRQIRKHQKIKNSHVTQVALVGLMLVVVMLPNVLKDSEATAAVYAPSDAWQSSLLWLKDNSPEPFNGQDVYYNNYQYKSSAVSEPDYGITSWWDYGYWIPRIAHRVPNTNPSQSPEPIKLTASLLLWNTERTDILQAFKTKYIILDSDLVLGKFYALGEWVGKDSEIYMREYYVQQNNKITQVEIFDIEYYKTLAVQLYNFDGKGASNLQASVITFEERGNSRMITNKKDFSNYQEAQAYAKKNGGIIVGINPFISPIPLDPIPNFKLIHSSDQTTNYFGKIPQVKIFEYAPE